MPAKHPRRPKKNYCTVFYNLTIFDGITENHGSLTAQESKSLGYAVGSRALAGLAERMSTQYQSRNKIKPGE